MISAAAVHFSTQSLLLAGSATLVGLIHSLAPGHWLPVVLLTKARRWPIRTAVLGALTAAMGHILVSTVIGITAIEVGVHVFADLEETIESYAGKGLIVFGILYAIQAYFRHSSCSGHEHHGPEPEKSRGPFVFLFFLGFSPCVAVLPVFAAAGTHGAFTTILTMICFSLGVVAALVGGTVLVSLGLMKLDHPIFEHYGDVITGLGLAGMGVLLTFFPH